MVQLVLLQSRLQAIRPYAAACALLLVAGWWGIFRKAGIFPWLAVISPVNIGGIYRVAWGRLRQFAAFVLCAAGAFVLLYTFGLASRSPDIQARMICMGAGGVLLIAALALDLITHVRLARRFAKGGLFTLGLIFLRPVFCPILGFDKSRMTDRPDAEPGGGNRNG